MQTVRIHKHTQREREKKKSKLTFIMENIFNKSKTQKTTETIVIILYIFLVSITLGVLFYGNDKCPRRLCLCARISMSNWKWK